MEANLGHNILIKTRTFSRVPELTYSADKYLPLVRSELLNICSWGADFEFVPVVEGKLDQSHPLDCGARVTCFIKGAYVDLQFRNVAMVQ